MLINAERRWGTLVSRWWVTVTGKRQQDGNGNVAITGQIIIFRALIGTIYVR